MMYSYVREGVKTMPIDELGDPERCIVLEETMSDLNYIQCLQAIKCEGYFYKDDQPLTNEASFKHLTDGEQLSQKLMMSITISIIQITKTTTIA